MQKDRPKQVWFVRSRLMPWTRTPVSSAGWLVIFCAFVAYTAIGAGTAIWANARPGHAMAAVTLGAIAFALVTLTVARTIGRHTGPPPGG